MSEREAAVWAAIERELIALGEADIIAGFGWMGDAPNAELWQSRVARAAIEAGEPHAKREPTTR